MPGIPPSPDQDLRHRVEELEKELIQHSKEVKAKDCYLEIIGGRWLIIDMYEGSNPHVWNLDNIIQIYLYASDSNDKKGEVQFNVRHRKDTTHWILKRERAEEILKQFQDALRLLAGE